MIYLVSGLVTLSNVLHAHAITGSHACIVVCPAIASADIIQVVVASLGIWLAKSLAAVPACARVEHAELVSIFEVVVIHATLNISVVVVGVAVPVAFAAGLVIVGAVSLVLGAALGIAVPAES